MIRKNTLLIIAFALFAFALNAQNSSGGVPMDCKVGFQAVLLQGNPNTVNFYASLISPDGEVVVYPGSNDTPLWFWDFGDGETSNEQNPVHTYKSDSIKAFIVNLTVLVGDNCKSFYSDIVYLGGFVPQTCSSRFSWYRNDSIMTFAEGYPVSFIDESGSKDSEITEWLWDFGDGYTSNEKNPMHIYQPLNMSPMPPDFWVSLTIKTASGCESTYSESVSLKTVYVPECQSYFAYEPIFDPATGTSIAEVHFYEKLTGNAISRLWDFGDGTTSTEESPVHNYSFLNGPYVVTLTITTETGCVSSFSDYIRIGKSNGDCYPSFYYMRPDSLISIPELINYQFIDNSEGEIIKRTWDFGDGFFSNEKSPVHNYYFQGGYFMVSLTIVTASGCESTYSEYIYVGGPDIYPVDTCPYYINVVTGQNPLQDNLCNGTATAAVFDYNGQQIEMDKFYWSNGNEGISTENLCYNKYYSVKAITPGGCGVSTDFTLYDGAYLDSGMVDPGIDWTTINDSLLYYFNYPFITDSSWVCVWDFGDGQTAEGTNVSHEYFTNGYYNVSLTIIDSNGAKVFSKAMEVSNATSVKKPVAAVGYSIYPNPVGDVLNINFDSKKSGISTISVIDVTGKTLFTKTLDLSSSSALNVPVNELPAGMYFAKIMRQGENTVVLKFVK